MALIFLKNFLELFSGVGVDDVGFTVDSTFEVNFITFGIANFFLFFIEDIEDDISSDFSDFFDVSEKIFVSFDVIVAIPVAYFQSL